MSGNGKKNITATILEKVARNSVKAAADSRCMYCLHQPKSPTGIKQFLKQDCGGNTRKWAAKYHNGCSSPIIKLDTITKINMI